jgi:hypothetical protein
MQKLTMPSARKGPESAGYFGRHPVFKPEAALAWYRAQITPTRASLFRKKAKKVAGR